MKYRNIESGTIIEIHSVLKSEFWAEVNEPLPITPNKRTASKKKVSAKNADSEQLRDNC